MPQAISQSCIATSSITLTEFTGASLLPCRSANNSDDRLTGTADNCLFNGALTIGNLEQSSIGAHRDSLGDKTARYKGAHIKTLKTIRSVRYMEGERSHGITTANTSPALIKGDARIAIPKDRGGYLGQKKKLKELEESVCTDCGQLPIYTCFSQD